MENISVLTGYLCKNGLRNPDGSVKHVILSEQGYTSHSFNQGNVEWKQAAALAYAYYVTEANPYCNERSRCEAGGRCGNTSGPLV